MLPKKNRSTKSDLDNLFKFGSFASSPVFSCRYIISDNKNPQVSFVAPKNIAKLATDRNLLRRKGYSAIYPSLPSLPRGFVGVFVFKQKEKDLLKIKHDLEKILNKIN